MKKFLNWQVVLGIILITCSAAVYYIHYLIFRDLRHIFFYLIGDIAFVFLEVLLVTLVVHKLLNLREKRAMLKKLNMVIGAFFSEVGINLIKLCSGFDSDNCAIAKDLIINSDWKDAEFARMERNILNYACGVDYKKGDIEGLKDFLVKKRGFLLALLENPNLLEHESFTDLLWATFHLTEELDNRKSLKNLTVADCEHIAGDIKRAYRALIHEWLAYMKHLKSDYPYLFSLAMRTNPFDKNAFIEVR